MLSMGEWNIFKFKTLNFHHPNTLSEIYYNHFYFRVVGTDFAGNVYIPHSHVWIKLYPYTKKSSLALVVGSSLKFVATRNEKTWSWIVHVFYTLLDTFFYGLKRLARYHRTVSYCILGWRCGAVWLLKFHTKFSQYIYTKNSCLLQQSVLRKWKWQLNVLLLSQHI